MILEIFNKERERIGMIKQYISARYANKYNGIGTFTIKVPVVDDSVRYLIIDNYVLLDIDVMGVITYRSKLTTATTEITVSGYIASHILTYRTFLKTQVFNGTIEDICGQMVANNFITPEDERRKIDYVKVESKVGSGESKQVQKTGGNIEEAIESLLAVENKGFSFKPTIAKFNEETDSLTNISHFTFEVLEPIDRSFANTQGNVPVVFSMELKNLEELSFTEDANEYKNVAVVAGTGEGEDRVLLEVGDLEASGVDRKELYVDARDVSKTKYVDSTEVIIPDNEYREMLQSRGNEYLQDYVTFVDMDGKIVVEGNTANKYGKDYFLGDIVSVVDDELGLAINAQVTVVTKTISSGTEKVDLTFGYEKESMRKVLKKRGVM